jgi:hypothetical protein
MLLGWDLRKQCCQISELINFLFTMFHPMCFLKISYQTHFLQEFTFLPLNVFAKLAWSMFGATNVSDLNSKNNY